MLSLGPKKDGGPNAKFFESPEVLAQLDGVKQWLLKNCKKVCSSMRTWTRRRKNSSKFLRTRFDTIFRFRRTCSRCRDYFDDRCRRRNEFQEFRENFHNARSRPDYCRGENQPDDPLQLLSVIYVMVCEI